MARNTRHLFLVPWRDCTLVGVWHAIVPRAPDSVGLERSELRQFIDEFNASYPALGLAESDVRRVDYGLVPFGEASKQHGGLSFGKESRLIDHRGHGGLSGLVSVISVRYTVARRDAVEALDLAGAQLGGRRPAHASATQRCPVAISTITTGVALPLRAASGLAADRGRRAVAAQLRHPGGSYSVARRARAAPHAALPGQPRSPTRRRCLPCARRWPSV